MIKIAICEDQPIVLKGIGSIVNDYEDLTVIHLCENGEILLKTIQETTVVPDIILMDLDMPIMGGFETTKIVKERYPNTKIIILSTHKGTEYIEKAIYEGAEAYLTKGMEPEELYEAITEVHKNGFYFNEMISYKRIQEYLKTGKLKANFSQHKELSPNEIEIVKLICEEKTAAEIADQLHLGEGTINTYRKEIMEKIGAKKIQGIVVYAIKNEIFIP